MAHSRSTQYQWVLPALVRSTLHVDWLDFACSKTFSSLRQCTTTTMNKTSCDGTFCSIALGPWVEPFKPRTRWSTSDHNNPLDHHFLCHRMCRTYDPRLTDEIHFLRIWHQVQAKTMSSIIGRNFRPWSWTGATYGSRCFHEEKEVARVCSTCSLRYK